MEQLVQDIANLKEQETAFLAQCAMAETEEEERAFTNELNIVRNKLSEKELALEELKQKEQQRADVIEEKVHAEGVPFKVAGLNLDGIPVQVVQMIEEVVKVDRRRIFKEHAIELEQLEQEKFKMSEDSLVDATRIGELEAEAGEWRNLLDEEMKRRHQLEFDLHHAESKRDAAVREKEELERVFREELAHRQAEIARLQSEVEDYQRAKVFGERQAQQIIDVTPEETTTLQEKADAVKKLFATVEDWGSVMKVVKPDGTFERVSREELANDWTPVVPELPSFRSEGETTAAESQDIGVQAPEVAATVGESFLGDTTEQQSDRTDVNGTDVAASGEEATLEERVAKLEAAVFGWQAVA